MAATDSMRQQQAPAVRLWGVAADCCRSLPRIQPFGLIIPWSLVRFQPGPPRNSSQAGRHRALQGAPYRARAGERRARRFYCIVTRTDLLAIAGELRELP